MPIYGSADALARSGPAGASESAAIAAGQARTDAFNWAKAVEANKKQNQTKQQAKSKLKKIAAKPKALVQKAPAAAAPAASPKELLDAFRAMNNGALPPGITADMASLIDSGINIQGMAATNPAMANVMMQVQQALSQIPADYAAGKASVNASYDKLTGDVLDSGKQWMQDLYGRVVDPNDPNAALAQADPALTDYSKSMSQIDETSDQNRATDLAWFDKTQQNSTQMYQNMLAQLAAQAATPVAASGGGGGGGHGRGGRRGGGGSGGGKVNGWAVPSNKLANLTSATDTATDTTTGYSPDFHQALMDYTAGDPEEQAFAQNQWELTPNQSATGLTTLNAKDRGSATAILKSLELQKGLNAGWTQQAPAHLQEAIGNMLRNKQGAILGDDPKTKKVETYYYPEGAGPGTGEVQQLSDEQKTQNQMAEELLSRVSSLPARQTAARIFNPKGQMRAPVGVLSPEGQMEWDTKGAISPDQIKIMARYGQKAATAAQQHDTTQQPFDWNSWAAGGNYVPPPDEKLAKDTQKNIGYFNDMNSFILNWNPNANFVPTKRQLVSQGKDSSTYTSSNTSKSWPNALAQNPLNLSGSIPEAAVENNPLSNQQGFEDLFTNPTDEVVTNGPSGRLMRLPSGSRNIIEQAAASAMHPDTVKTQAKGRLASMLRQPISRPQAAPTPAPVQRPVTPAPVRSSQPYHSITDFLFGTPAPAPVKFVQGKGPVLPKKTAPAASPFTGFAARLFHK